MKIRIVISLIWLVVPVMLIVGTTPRLVAQRVGEPLPVWQEGQFDIHQINTGQGNAALLIFPDGTSLLIDAGAINALDWRTGQPRNLPIYPTRERQAGEWIARYARQALRFRQNPAIDYALITHFHDDHMGTPLNVAGRAAGGYVLAGITEVAAHIPIRTILDRGWPDYRYPRPLDADSMVANYRRFLHWQQQHNGLVAERFQAGRSDQIRPLTKTTYPFEVRNLLVNGELWTGQGSQTQPLFPDLASLPTASLPNENMCSIALRIRYGGFTYFSAGDVQGVLRFGLPSWHDVETPLAAVAGPVDVQLVDHHGYPDAENGSLLAALRPRVLVVPAWAPSHPGPDVLERMMSTQAYPGDRDVFVTSLLPEAKAALSAWLPQLKSQSGHVVVRVEQGGSRYRVFVLDDTNERGTIKAIHGYYRSGTR